MAIQNPASPTGLAVTTVDCIESRITQEPGPFNALIFGGLGRVSPKCHTPKPTALG